MLSKAIYGTTRRIGKSQGYLGLAIRDDVKPVNIGGVTENVPTMTSCWELTPSEAKRIAAGADVYVEILGMKHPPIIVRVGTDPAAGPDSTVPEVDPVPGFYYARHLATGQLSVVEFGKDGNWRALGKAGAVDDVTKYFELVARIPSPEAGDDER